MRNENGIKYSYLCRFIYASNASNVTSAFHIFFSARYYCCSFFRLLNVFTRYGLRITLLFSFYRICLPNDVTRMDSERYYVYEGNRYRITIRVNGSTIINTFLCSTNASGQFSHCVSCGTYGNSILLYGNYSNRGGYWWPAYGGRAFLRIQH